MFQYFDKETEENFMRRTSAGFSFIIVAFLITIFAVLSAFAQQKTVDATRQSGFAGGETAFAQTAADDFDAKNELSVLGGFASRALGNLRKSNFGFAAVRYSRRIASSDSLALKYQIDFLPLAVIEYDKQLVTQTAPATFAVRNERTTAYGAGFSPVGLQLNFRRRNKIQPFAAVNAGLIYFNKSIPDDRTATFPNRFGTHLNFATNAGGGVEFASESSSAVTVGYKFQHISNASRGNINPGFNQNILYVGYTFKKW